MESKLLGPLSLSSQVEVQYECEFLAGCGSYCIYFGSVV